MGRTIVMVAVLAGCMGREPISDEESCGSIVEAYADEKSACVEDDPNNGLYNLSNLWRRCENGPSDCSQPDADETCECRRAADERYCADLLAECEGQ